LPKKLSPTKIREMFSKMLEENGELTFWDFWEKSELGYVSARSLFKQFLVEYSKKDGYIVDMETMMIKKVSVLG
jgi:hypothetical protein